MIELRRVLRNRLMTVPMVTQITLGTALVNILMVSLIMFNAFTFKSAIVIACCMLIPALGAVGAISGLASLTRSETSRLGAMGLIANIVMFLGFLGWMSIVTRPFNGE